MSYRNLGTPRKLTGKIEKNGTLSDVKPVEERFEPDDILNETMFQDNPIEEKPISDKKTPYQVKREQEKKYKGYVGTVDDIKKFSMGAAKVLLNINGYIKDARKHLSTQEALSIAEPSYRLFDRNILSKLEKLLPEIEDENKKDIKEILTSLASWGVRASMVWLADWTSKNELKVAQSQLATMKLQQEMRKRQEEELKEYKEEYVGASMSKDNSLNMISVDPNQLDPEVIGPENDGVYGV